MTTNTPMDLEPASRETPPIQGLYVFPRLIPAEDQARVIRQIAQADVFRGGKRDQVMYFPSDPRDRRGRRRRGGSGGGRADGIDGNDGVSGDDRGKVGMQRPTDESRATLAWESRSSGKRRVGSIAGPGRDNWERTGSGSRSERSVSSDPRPAKIGQEEVDQAGAKKSFPTDTESLITSERELAHRSPTSDPEFLRTTLNLVQSLLCEKIPEYLMHLLFDPPYPPPNLSDESPRRRPRRRQRQSIVNLYPPTHGISPHVDIPDKYADGILGVCLGGGCVMNFDEVDLKQDDDSGGLWGGSSDDEDDQGDGGGNIKSEGNARRKRYDVYLPAGTVYILSEQARWNWTHGIEGRAEDLVYDDEVQSSSSIEDARLGRAERPRTATRILRSTRISITYRWLKSKAAHDGLEGEVQEGNGILLQELAGEDDWNVR